MIWRIIIIQTVLENKKFQKEIKIKKINKNKLTSILFDVFRLKLNKFPKCVEDDDEGNVDDVADDDVANNGIIFFK